MNCSYHPIYRNCVTCGNLLERGEVRVCVSPVGSVQSVVDLARKDERARALREARNLIKTHAVMAWNGGQIERSDGITDVLVDFDLKFPEGRNEDG